MNIKQVQHLLAPDSVGGSSDPLDENINDVNTDYPILPASWYVFRIDGAKKEPNRAGTGENLVVPLKLVEPAQDKKGETVSPGMVLTHRCSVTPTEKYTVDMLKKNVSRLAKAAGLICTVRDIINNPSMLDGKALKVKVKVNKETSEFPESNGAGDFAAID